MARRAVLIPGDGVGPEVIDAARRVLRAAGAELAWELREAEDPATPAAVRACGVALKGPVAAVRGRRSPTLRLREALGLEIGVRPCRGRGLDVVVVRMLAEDLYAGLEAPPEAVGLPSDAGVSVKFFTRRTVARAAEAAFGWAVAAGRRRVTIVHKATVMPATDGLFLDAARAAAPDALTVDDRLVDAVCHDLAAGRAGPDVLFCGMLYGDLLSDLCAGLTGGLGMAPGANLGPDCAVFEPVHGTATRRIGVANPFAAIRTGALLLRHLGEDAAADRVDAAVDAVARAGRTVTSDLGGSATTGEAADAVIAALEDA